MLFNLINPWRKFPNHKPKKDDRYLCTVQYGEELEDICVIELHYEKWRDAWVDERRFNVFEGYKVYKQSRAAVEDNRIFKDSLCDRTLDVIAWKRLPRVYKGL